MNTGLKLRVVTPAGPAVDLWVDAVTACSEMGEFCVLPDHRPILAALIPGRLMVESNGETRIYATDVGFFEGGADHVNVMTQHCVAKAEAIECIDVLEDDQETLTEELNHLEDDSPARDTVQSSLTWVEAQLSVAKDEKKRR